MLNKKDHTAVTINPINIIDYVEHSEFNDGKEKVWLISSLIEKSKNLFIREMPMTGLNIFNIHPKIRNMNDFVAHMQEVAKVDMKSPIIIDDEGYLMFGRHQIARALLDGNHTIKYVRFEKTPIPDFIRDK